jgi:hypothetical protein
VGPASVAGRPTEALRGIGVDRLDWLAGAWQGAIGGDQVEEHWAVPAGGTMVGMFRWLRDGQPRFYELLLLEADGEELTMLIRHFQPGLIGWEREREAPTRFALAHLGENEAIFVERNVHVGVWLTYRRSGDELEAIFERDDQAYDPASAFRYRRAGA